MKKVRADVLLCERGIFETPHEAAVYIMEGKVRLSKDNVLMKPSQMIDVDAPLLVDTRSEYVSRGAYKLIPALEKYLPDLTGLVAMDMGASTGGFTDVMLRHGAAKVYAVDVGKGLLHGKLRNDPRVVLREGINIKSVSPEIIGDPVDLVTGDLSFISVTKALEPANSVLKQGGYGFILVKPQFEAPREDVPVGGIVTDPAVQQAAVDKVRSFATETLNWECLEVLPSPIKGSKGNQEFVAVFRKR